MPSGQARLAAAGLQDEEEPGLSAKPLFEINPDLDIQGYAARFAQDRRIQVRDVLTDETARTIRTILAQETRWGLAWRAGSDGPHGVRAEDLSAMGAPGRQAIGTRVSQAMTGADYGFAYAQYRMLDAYLERWAPGSPHDLLLEYINAEPFLDLVRRITGMPSLLKADAQATLYAPGHFLACHDDSHVAEGWQVAYVLNLGLDEWRQDWGGYLLFYDDDGDVVSGYRPRFNALNLFAVPQSHSVSYVPPFAPVGRFAITGWFRDR